MKELKHYIEVLAVILMTCPICTSQTIDSLYSLRLQGQLSILAGAGGSNGVHAGARYNISNSSSVELTYGIIPFIEIAGEQAKIIGTSYNYYLHPSTSSTGFFSFLLSYFRTETTEGRIKGDFFILSPTFGIDVSSESSFGLLIRMGVGTAVGPSTSGKIVFNFDIGTTYRIL